MLVLDIATDTDIRTTSEVGRLHNDIQIRKDKTLTFNLPATAKNNAALREHISPNKYGREYEPLDVRVWSGGVILEYTKLWIQGTDDNSGEILAIMLTPDHWINKAAATKLNEIDYGQMDFSNQTVRNEMIQNSSFADGDGGHYWLLGDFGVVLAETEGVQLEYIRPVLSALHAMREGFCHIGWECEFQALEGTLGRRLWLYLLRDNYNENPFLKDHRRFIAKTSATKTYADFELDEVVTDPDGGWRADRGAYLLKSGESRFIIEGFLSAQHSGNQGNPNPEQSSNLDAIVTIKRRNRTGSNQVLVRGVTIRVGLSNNGYITGKTDPIPHREGDEVSVTIRTDYTLTFERIDLKFEIEPVKTYYSNGDIIDWREVIHPDYTLLDLVKGIMHPFQAHYDTDWNERKVSFYPPFDVNWGGDDLEGFYQVDASAEDLSELVIQDSEVRRVQERNQARFIEIGWKGDGDSYISEEYDQPEDGAPIYGVRVDMGESFDDKSEERKNPFFEATMNRWVSMREDFKFPVNMPVLWDNQGGEKRSYKIAPRMFLSYGWDAQYYGTGNSFELTSWQFLGAVENSIPLMAQVPQWFIDGAGTEESEWIRYGIDQDSFYNKFWKKWLQFTANNVRLEYLMWIDRNKARELSFRKPYAITYGTTKMFGWIEEIRDRSECEEVATPIRFIPLISDFDCEPSVVGLERCRNDFILTDVRAGDCITFDTENIGAIPGDTTQEWKYEDATGWTNLPGVAQVCDATGVFTYRQTQEYGGCRSVTRTRTVNPCENYPVLEWDVYTDASGHMCFSVEVGGTSVKTIHSVDLEVSYDGSAFVPYTEGEEQCGEWGVVCVSGMVDYVGSCPSIMVSGCREFPPETYPCEDNEVGVVCVAASGECGSGVAFERIGELIAPVAIDSIYYRCEGDMQWRLWDEGEVVCCSDIDFKRVVVFCNGACPTVCVEGECSGVCTPFEPGTPLNIAACNDGAV